MNIFIVLLHSLKVGHMGNNLPWSPSPPVQASWHHLVYTYDGSTYRVYADGSLSNSGTGTLSISSAGPIALGAFMTGGAIVTNSNYYGSLTLARVRIHSDVLSLTQILSNYQLELCTFSSTCTASTECTAASSPNFSIGAVTVVSTSSITVASASPSASGLYTICYEPNGSSTWQTSFRLLVPAVTSFTPTTALVSTATTITFSGSALGSNDQLKAVAPGSTCSASSSASVAFTAITLNLGGTLTSSVTASAAGIYPLCHQPGGSATGYYQAGSVNSLYVPSSTSFSPSLMMAGTSTTTLTLTGVALDATYSIRAIYFGSNSACTTVTAALSVTNVTGSANTQVTFMPPVSGLAPGSYAVCVNYLAASASTYTIVGASDLTVPNATSFTPSSIGPVSGQSVTVSGVVMPNVSGDGVAFLMAVSCSSPSAISPTPVSGTSISSSGSGSSMTINVSAIGDTPGAYQLCVRWNATFPYSLVGTLSVLTVSSLSPSIIPVSSTAPTVTVAGTGLVTVTADSSAFVISSASCTSASSVVTSVSSTFTSSSSITMTVTDSSAAAGVYSLCMRVSSSSSYFSAGVSLTIGIIIALLYACYLLNHSFLLPQRLFQALIQLPHCHPPLRSSPSTALCFPISRQMQTVCSSLRLAPLHLPSWQAHRRPMLFLRHL